MAIACAASAWTGAATHDSAATSKTATGRAVLRFFIGEKRLRAIRSVTRNVARRSDGIGSHSGLYLSAQLGYWAESGASGVTLLPYSASIDLRLGVPRSAATGVGSSDIGSLNTPVRPGKPTSVDLHAAAAKEEPDL